MPCLTEMGDCVACMVWTEGGAAIACNNWATLAKRSFELPFGLFSTQQVMRSPSDIVPAPTLSDHSKVTFGQAFRNMPICTNKLSKDRFIGEAGIVEEDNIILLSSLR
ncbi:MAG: hypothetical protein AAGJ95_17240 [Cyanobacteria bacterium J06554_11]